MPQILRFGVIMILLSFTFKNFTFEILSIFWIYFCFNCCCFIIFYCEKCQFYLFKLVTEAILLVILRESSWPSLLAARRISYIHLRMFSAFPGYFSRYTDMYAMNVVVHKCMFVIALKCCLSATRGTFHDPQQNYQKSPTVPKPGVDPVY